MKTLEEVKMVFPTAKYPPMAGCKKCKGEGMFKHESSGDRWRPCMCIFIEHSFVDVARETMREVVAEMKKPEVKEKIVKEVVETLSRNRDPYKIPPSMKIP